MKNLACVLRTMRREEEGLTTVEYAVAGGLIAATVVGAFVLLGGEVDAIITYIYNQLGGSPGA